MSGGGGNTLLGGIEGAVLGPYTAVAGAISGAKNFGNAVAGIPKTIGDGIAQIDGSASAQKALNLAQQQFNYAQAQAQQLITQTNWNTYAGDITASGAAAASQATAKQSGGINYSNATPLAIGPGASPTSNKDLLGI